MTINVEPSAVKRIQELRETQGKETLMLRIVVEGGGCSGFQYKMELTEETTDKDQTFNAAVVTDDISLGFLDGTTISFEEGLIGSEFKLDNPNAVSGCGCGSSFSV
ncbi:MAG: heme biosynthesis protein HemY [Micavibrio sp.]|nr:MAG: heme biosynthesis protein HemY [Micavibrio sp.]